MTQAPGPKDPHAVRPAFAPGVPLAPAASLRAWLDEQASERLVRLPIRVQVNEFGEVLFRGAQIGAAADALSIELDDSAMGLGLADRLRGKIPDGAASVGVRLDGLWETGTLSIREVGEVLDDAAFAAITVAELAAP